MEMIIASKEILGLIETCVDHNVYTEINREQKIAAK